MKAIRAGVDTWSVAWQVEEGSFAEHALDGLATVPSARGRRLPDKLNGYTVGYFPGTRLAYAEGHPFGVEGTLVPPRDLPAALVALVRDLEEVGIHFDRGRTRARFRRRPGDGYVTPGF